MSFLLEIVLRFLSKPTNLIIVGLVGMLTFTGVTVFYKNMTIAALETKIEKVGVSLSKCESERNQEREVYKANLHTLKTEIGEFQRLTNDWQTVIDDKNIQIGKEQDRVEYWKNQYKNKICVNNDGEMVKPSDKVINNESNSKVLDVINQMFGVQK